MDIDGQKVASFWTWSALVAGEHARRQCAVFVHSMCRSPGFPHCSMNAFLLLGFPCLIQVFRQEHLFDGAPLQVNGALLPQGYVSYIIRLYRHLDMLISASGMGSELPHAGSRPAPVCVQVSTCSCSCSENTSSADENCSTIFFVLRCKLLPGAEPRIRNMSF